MTVNTEIAGLTALEMLELFELGELSPVDATEAAFGQIHALDEHVNAWCHLDEETTLAEARRSEERWRRGMPMGTLDGVPVAVKDVFMTRGWPNRKGSKVVPDTPVGDDAPIVVSLRRNGFVPLGKTTTPEFGWKGVTDSPLCGPTNNPWNPTLTAGGSSGGSGAAVPLGMGPLALGTDAGGSIRIPAAFCGIVGHKPTQGRIPFWPTSPFGQLAHPGPMTWTVADSALMMDVLCERDARDSTLPANDINFLDAIEGGVKGWRIAFSPNLGYVDVNPEIAASVRAAARVFEDLGAHVEEIDPGFSDPLESFNVLFYGGAANALRDIPASQREIMDPNLIRVSEWAEQLSLLDYLGAMNVRGALIERTSRFHERYDLLLTPTLPIPAFTTNREVPEQWDHERWPTWTPFTYPFNMTGQPACSVPCGFTADDRPIGLQLVGARHRDDKVLRGAHAYQQAHPLTQRRPKLFDNPAD